MAKATDKQALRQVGEKKNELAGKLKKVHVSHEYCRECGEKQSKSERWESGHSHYKHLD